MIESLTDQEKRFFKDHGLVIIKPDAIKLYLENLFIQDFEQLDLFVKYRQFLCLKPEDILFLYPEWVSNTKKIAALRDIMTEGAVMILLLQSQSSQVQTDLHHLIKRKKGYADEPGLRRKYIHIFENELREKYPDHDQFLRELNKNRIHSPEHALEALSTLIYLWPRFDQTAIHRMLPDLYGIMTSRLSIVKT